MDSLDAIQRQYLQGDVLAQQGEALKADAFNRLLNLRVPLDSGGAGDSCGQGGGVMATLILRNAEGVEVSRRDMAPQERFALYHACQADELLSVAGKRYRVVTVAWRIPEETCACTVVFDSWEPSDGCS